MLTAASSQTKLFVSSELPIYQIFSDDSTSKGEVSDHMRSVMDDLVSTPRSRPLFPPVWVH